MDHKTSAPVLSQRQLSRTAELFRGLARLTGEKPYGEITVAEIAREAGIHRATFYRHFETKDDLLQRGAEIFWDGMNRKISARRLEMGKLKGFHERIRSMMGFFFNEVEENREILTPLLGSSGPPVFRKITEQRLTSYIEEFRLGKILPPDRREIAAAFYRSCLLTAMEFILAGEERARVEELYFRFGTKGIGGLI